ncbi:MAG: hypothetical protein N4R99_06140, partial [Lactobacillus iners]|nr:hypothetical protein [Lactobacillus iners]
NYATKSDLDSHKPDLSNYATKSDLDSHKPDLSNYATKNELNNKADRSELGNYATKDDLNSHQPDLSNYATKSDLDNKVDRSDLNNYAYETQKALSNKANSSELDSYATKGDLDNKADKSELSNYATRGDINSAIQNVRIKQDSLDSGNNYTSGKIYSPEWSDGYLTFDMSGSYATYKTRSLVNHMSAMQEQITQLQLEVKKKIKLRSGDIIHGTLYADEKKVIFNMANFKDWQSKSYYCTMTQMKENAKDFNTSYYPMSSEEQTKKWETYAKSFTAKKTEDTIELTDFSTRYNYDPLSEFSYYLITQ